MILDCLVMYSFPYVFLYVHAYWYWYPSYPCYEDSSKIIHLTQK